LQSLGATKIPRPSYLSRVKRAAMHELDLSHLRSVDGLVALRDSIKAARSPHDAAG
jgi:hypothetical protein